AIAGAVKLCQLLLGQRHRSLVNAIGQAMLAEALGCFGIVLTGALAIDHKVGHGAVTLAGYLGCAISLQLDVTSQDDLNRAIHAAMAFRQGRLGLVGNLADCVTPGCASRIVWYRLAVQHVIPGNFCYNSHRSIPLSEGLTVGRVTRCLAAWVTRPCCF